jgi:hypothetical protein
MKKSRHSGSWRLIPALCGLLAACGFLPDGASPLPDPSPTGSASPAASPLASPLPSPSASPSPSLSPSTGPSIPPTSHPGTALIIDHSNFDPAGLSAAEISAAAALDVYFQHASVGGNVCDGIDALAGESGSRYACDRGGSGEATDPAWFDAHNGLWDYQRGNPGFSQKVIDFTDSIHASVLATKLDVATYKFCWIDTPGDAALSFAEARSAMEALETEYPSIDFVWWTMPIEENTALQTRQDFNDLVRAYCATYGKWLLDIADLESHDDTGVIKVDGSERELQVSDYSSDGGHLNAAGERKMALAWWRLMAAIAASR